MDEFSWRDKYKDIPAISQQTVLEVVWSDAPNDVYQDAMNLGRDYELGNDSYHSYNKKYIDEDFGENYPALYAYLEEHGIESCLISIWW